MDKTKETLIFDLSSNADVDNWRSIDDRIMGGMSESRVRFIEGVGMRFSGVVSLANNGGFASIRSASKPYDLSVFSEIKLRVCGDGNTYKLSLRTDRFFDGISYQMAFLTTNQWQDITLPFSKFIPTHHGTTLSSAAPLNPAKVQSFGLFIADQQAGSFQLDVAWIKAAFE
ncbi:MAG: CIA30 family protein [Deltaproteobacteria bacterium]|nr:CIA30 family protein [Deltaproteobacteria bacterium]